MHEFLRKKYKEWAEKQNQITISPEEAFNAGFNLFESVLIHGVSTRQDSSETITAGELIQSAKDEALRR